MIVINPTLPITDRILTCCTFHWLLIYSNEFCEFDSLAFAFVCISIKIFYYQQLQKTDIDAS